MRIPGEGTDKLINRQHEADVYRTLKGKISAMTLNISTPKMAIKSLNFWKKPKCVIL